MKDEVSAHNTCNCTTGTNRGQFTMQVEDQMWDSGSQSAQQIEDEITQMPKPIFHIVAKDVKEPHVTQQMKKTAMQEHKREERDHLLAGSKVCWNLRDGITRRHKAININKLVKSLPLRQLHKKNQHIDRNEEGVDDWIGLGPDGASNGDHTLKKYQSMMTESMEMCCSQRWSTNQTNRGLLRLWSHVRNGELWGNN